MKLSRFDKGFDLYANPLVWNTIHQIMEPYIVFEKFFSHKSDIKRSNLIIVFLFQTGSGKTFSITGDHWNYEDRGILPRTLEHIFQYIRKVNLKGTITSTFSHWKIVSKN